LLVLKRVITEASGLVLALLRRRRRQGDNKFMAQVLHGNKDSTVVDALLASKNNYM
jgi:hypothetical protein